ncbi:uncharacterized protein PSANT_00596 [Moesziomyces antarcticus]|uniref:Uncharacterized protein n=1 Tax=Pseudozyma antarctica TaxID=84753 RepID=A0A5C3FEQ8_PSEA2|nr:uncharacterized protein PSANT_00596 [Moesziomyces antarcticus]
MHGASDAEVALHPARSEAYRRAWTNAYSRVDKEQRLARESSDRAAPTARQADWCTCQSGQWRARLGSGKDLEPQSSLRFMHVQLPVPSLLPQPETRSQSSPRQRPSKAAAALASTRKLNRMRSSQWRTPLLRSAARPAKFILATASGFETLVVMLDAAAAAAA